MRYTLPSVIRSFKDRRTAALFRGDTVASFQAIEKVAHRKLDMLDGATGSRIWRHRPATASKR
jgi:plasmid maintenance system killer protein